MSLICLLMVTPQTNSALTSCLFGCEETDAAMPPLDQVDLNQAASEQVETFLNENKIGYHKDYIYTSQDLKLDISRGWQMILVVNRSEAPQFGQTLTVYLGGQPYRQWPVSTALEGFKQRPQGEMMFATTPTGRFVIKDIYSEYHSHTWDEDLNDMIFFGNRQDGIAFHSAPNKKADKKIGKRDSAGCVRLHRIHADELFQLVRKYKKSTLVIIQQNDTPSENSVPPLKNLKALQTLI